jgi:hypothetical protein
MFTPPKNAGVTLFPGFWFHYFVISAGCNPNPDKPELNIED